MADGLVSSQGVRLLGQVRLPGGAGMQIQRHAQRVFVGQLIPGGGTAVVDVSVPSAPRLVGHLPGYAGAVSPKVQVAGDRLYVNYEARAGAAERSGFAIFDLTAEGLPREMAYVPTGGRGVHRMWCTEERCYVSGVPDGFRDRVFSVYDVADPGRVSLLGRWWIPGLYADGGEEPTWPEGLSWNLHHAVVHGDRAYLGCWDAGVKILDISDEAQPRLVGELGGWAPAEGGATHTALPLPGRGLLVVTDEALAGDPVPNRKRIRVLDIRDERQPRLLAFCPEPPPRAVPGHRFGPHNLHEPRPGAFRSETLIFATYYAGGLRLYDLSDPTAPQEVGHFLPDPPPGQQAIQLNDVYVHGDGMIYVSDRGMGGLYILALDERLLERHALS